MSEDIVSELKTYRLQLEHVTASLTLDPDNEELAKLRNDLLEVIDLTEQLLPNESELDSSVDATTSDDHRSKSTDSSKDGPGSLPPSKWKIGDVCLALYPKDGKYYPGKIVHKDAKDVLNRIVVRFGKNYGQITTDENQIKQIPTESLKTSSGGGDGAARGGRKRNASEYREYLKSRKEKKDQRLVEIATAGEKEKQKWQSFNSKSRKGLSKESIFKTSDSASSRSRRVRPCGSVSNMNRFDRPS